MDSTGLKTKPQAETGSAAGSARESSCAESILIRGRVQGVGFRPHVWRIANRFGIAGDVCNRSDGLQIRAWAGREQLDMFVESVIDAAPPAARIDSVDRELLQGRPTGVEFRILASEHVGGETQVAPDLPTCKACLAELQDQDNRRFRYPFINCTDCGPRLSIVRALPWDRAQTSMTEFAMCDACRQEFSDPAGRRFHAQPNCCAECGPVLRLNVSDDSAVETIGEEALQQSIALLRRGGILAIKSTGGWQIACDAACEQAVQRLRKAKHRPHKPFALMVRDLDMAAGLADLTTAARVALADPAAPVVLVPRRESARVAAQVAPGLDRLGLMLPHSGMHHLLMETFDFPLVMTSGNPAGEPQCIDDAEAFTTLRTIVDAFLGHGREIVQRVDDSVMSMTDAGPRVIRVGRGMAPLEIRLPCGCEDLPPVLAMGAQLKNAFALARDDRVLLSQHIGDLENVRAGEEYLRSLDLYRGLFRKPPGRIAVDLHPDYFATRMGSELAGSLGVELVQVQHHHAHLAACMLEHQLPAESPPVLGVVLDGMGYGLDGELWGGEFLLGGYQGFQRLGTFKPVALPGAAAAMREPWRNTWAHLEAELGWPWLQMNFSELELFGFLDRQPRASLSAMLEAGANAPLASSCGRLFDAVAAALGICREEISYEGQAAMELESIVDRVALREESEELAYPFSIPNLGGTGMPYIEPVAMWQALLGDLHLGTPVGVIAARFHRGLARAIVAMVVRLAGSEATRRFDTVCLAGGVFQNRTLLTEVSDLLERRGFEVRSQKRLPAGDGGIAAGQAMVAMVQPRVTQHEDVS